MGLFTKGKDAKSAETIDIEKRIEALEKMSRSLYVKEETRAAEEQFLRMIVKASFLGAAIGTGIGLIVRCALEAGTTQEVL